ncbi:glycosyltransferase family 4 protein [Paenibacillus protaetiae]|uniref:glycosyltransferase family 4 protein n=1 Tax=Paenibacillus protaetiae TaxID=2509456 RepID=UPI0013EBCF7F|nr:glycosyltransferase [Paenibacillus protaetiae]
MTLPTGIVWVAPIGEITGYGNVSRNLLRSLDLLNIPVHLVPIGRHEKEIGEEDRLFLERVNKPIEAIGEKPVLIIHAQPDTFPLIHFEGISFAKKIGITIFETDRIPPAWVEWCNAMDEIWLPSQFNMETFSRSGVDRDKLKLVPYSIQSEKYNQSFRPYPFHEAVKSFKFLYTCAFVYRKGIDLLVRAFCEEFSADEDVSLVLKIYVPSWHPHVDLPSLIRSYIPDLTNHPHIELIQDKIPIDDLLSLYHSSDCYVSTDRANGWGMPCMEMMAMGKPAITINWSGSTEFMKETNSFLIEPEAELEEVDVVLQQTLPGFYQGHQWAKVTTGNVRRTLREAYEDQEKRERIAKQARLDIEQKYSARAVADIIRSILDGTALNSGTASNQPYSLAWEGPVADIHSLAKVNRNIIRYLSSHSHIELTIGAFRPPFTQGTLTADVTVSHQYPPNFTVPVSKHWIVMQPWEFGSLPTAWYAPMKYWVDQVWVYSNYNKECYVRSGLDEHKIKVIPLGVDEHIFHPEVEPLALDVPAGFRFLFVGGTIWRKGVDLLIQAYTEEFRQDEDVSLIVKDFGTQSFYKGATSTAFLTAAAEAANSPHIVYMEQEYTEREMASLYKACDCLVHAYRGEGFGLPIIEAMACGIPVILPDKGPSADFCSADTAYLVDSTEVATIQPAIGSVPILSDVWWINTDLGALRRAMRYAFENRDEIKATGERASRKILNEYTWRHTADKAREAIEQLIHAHDPKT